MYEFRIDVDGKPVTYHGDRLPWRKAMEASRRLTAAGIDGMIGGASAFDVRDLVGAAMAAPERAKESVLSIMDPDLIALILSHTTRQAEGEMGVQLDRESHLDCYRGRLTEMWRAVLHVIAENQLIPFVDGSELPRLPDLAAAQFAATLAAQAKSRASDTE